MTPAGRRPGPSRTREAILAAGRAEFATGGYDAASVRAIAGRAGVDPAMINHHFGGKRGLFLATLAIPVDPVAQVRAVVEAGPDHDLGPRLVRHLLQVWDSPAGVAATTVLRTALQEPETAAAVREFVSRELLPAMLTGVPAVEVPLRSALVASQLGGLIFGRYLLAVPPLANADPDDLVAAVGVTLQRYLTGPLP